MVLCRFAICQDPAAPWLITSTTAAPSMPGLLTKEQRLGQALDEARDADLVHHLGDLARATVAEALADAGIGVDHRFGLGVIGLGAAAHHRKRAVFGPRLPARDRRVDEAEAEFGGLGRQLARHLGRDGGVIDEDRALGHAGKGAIRPEADRAQVIVIADTGHHESGTLRRLGGRGRRPCRHAP